MKYRKKPVVIDAVQWTGLNMSEIKAFCGDAVEDDINDAAWRAGVAPPVVSMVIPTLEGDLVVKPGAFIIRGVAGEYYPCDPDIFAATYEPVEAMEESR